MNYSSVTNEKMKQWGREAFAPGKNARQECPYEGYLTIEIEAWFEGWAESEVIYNNKGGDVKDLKEYFDKEAIKNSTPEQLINKFKEMKEENDELKRQLDMFGALMSVSVIPMLVTENGEENEPVLEVIACMSISGGAQYVNDMPKELTLRREFQDGTSYEMEYCQVVKVEFCTCGCKKMSLLDAPVLGVKCQSCGNRKNHE